MNFLTGGRGVIEGLGSQLKLSKRQVEPSFASLYFYGNTSSASYFYGVGFAENKQGIMKGDRVWQVLISKLCLWHFRYREFPLTMLKVFLQRPVHCNENKRLKGTCMACSPI